MTDALSLSLDRIAAVRPGVPIPREVVYAADAEVARIIPSHPLLDAIRAEVRRLPEGAGKTPAARPLATVHDVLAERLWTVCNLVHNGRVSGSAEPLVVAATLNRATPVLWLRDMVRASAAMQVPEHVLGRDVLPRHPLWFTFEVEYSGVGHAMDSLYGVLLDHTDRADFGDGPAEGLAWWFIGSDAEGSTVIVPNALAYGSRVPAGTANGTISVFGMLSFLNSPYIPVERKRLPRQQRRAIERRATAAADEEVWFVDLRPAVHHNARDETGDVGSPAYRHRWIVRGHHRAQWYPSKQAHKVIWIAPYVKGPEDAPLKDTVYRVVR